MMETGKKIGKALLFPPIALLWLLLPIAVGLLVYAMTTLESGHPVSIAAYVLSAYTLTIWCCRIPAILSFCGNFRRENKFVRRWNGDVRLRVRVSLYSSCLWNTAYAALQLGLGIFHGSFWYYSLAAYYLCLALMRFFLSRHTARHRAGEARRKELTQYRICGWIFLLINLAISMMVFLMICQNRAARHHPITTIALAAFTFTSFTTAIINTVKYRKYDSPVYSASKAISLAAACVSMITLTSTMLASFGDGSEDPRMRTFLLAGLGAAVAIFITAMALSMIRKANREIKQSGEFL